MPQMAPMLWMYSLMILSTLLIMMMSSMYFIKNELKLKMKKSSKGKNNWKW